MASSVVKKKGFGTTSEVSMPYTVPSDGIVTLIGTPTSSSASASIRMTIERSGTTLQIGNGAQLGICPSVTMPVIKGDIVAADYAYQSTLKCYYIPLE